MGVFVCFLCLLKMSSLSFKDMTFTGALETSETMTRPNPN